MRRLSSLQCEYCKIPFRRPLFYFPRQRQTSRESGSVPPAAFSFGSSEADLPEMRHRSAGRFFLWHRAWRAFRPHALTSLPATLGGIFDFLCMSLEIHERQIQPNKFRSRITCLTSDSGDEPAPASAGRDPRSGPRRARRHPQACLEGGRLGLRGRAPKAACGRRLPIPAVELRPEINPEADGV